ncbi:ubiquitin binding protein [Moesziomyces antarcticus]|uniref:Related to VPS27 - vacuolar protein sorting-associated protein n=2 Tax=Pseudozyma antarctica TaxID=84753 RepID=A0A5C3FT41_PSEA2|nr:ubiquitin binding protein [Moesziomyces antarcticus]GAK66176.1 ubiquitin binding protein [Moesziomyces antarcticus]SPO46955.1 related to VPS27 - vacuolar protein sorting-associated protein [Moesziomyces antarcticus]
MSALWSGWGADAFTEQVEKATSELLPVGSEDIALNLDICDQVRAKQVPAKQAMQVLKRRVSHKNPNVVLLALGLTDICIKNGGDHFLQEVASREFMDNLVSVLRNPAGVNHDVKAKALGLIQNWSQIAQAKPAQMAYIIDIYRQLKSDSAFDFPPLDPNAAASAALVETLTAPEWVDGDVCMRCRTAFTTFNRKHHCRNCGNVFCQQCSSHNMALPWFGIGQDVRVCDGCFARKGPPKNAAKLSRSKSAGSSSTYVPSGRGGSASHHRSATLSGQTGQSKRSARKKEEDDLALAIKLSLQSSGLSAPQSSRPEAPSNPQKAPNGRVLEGTDADDDPDLAAAIAASLRDWAPPQPSAPDGLNEASAPAASTANASEPLRSDLPLPPSLDLAPQDVDNILTFSQSVQAHHHQNQRSGMMGAPVPHQVQSLYEKASAARPRMARNLEEGHRRHNVLVSMHDKLTEAVRLYDRLLDAQMYRPAQSYAPNAPSHASYAAPAQHYAYDQHAPSHEAGAGYTPMHPGAASLYPHAPQAAHTPQAYPGASHPEYAQAPTQWQPHHEQPMYPQQQQPYPTQPAQSQSQHSAGPSAYPAQQHHQQQPYGAPNPAAGYPNAHYADPQATSSTPVTSPTQYDSYAHVGGMPNAPAHPPANGAPYDAASPYTEAPGAVPSAPAAGRGAPLSVRTDGISGIEAPNGPAAAAADAANAGNVGVGEEAANQSRLSGDTSTSSRNGWNPVPIQAVAPPLQNANGHAMPEQAVQQSQSQPQLTPQQHYHQPQQPQQQQPFSSKSPIASRSASHNIPQQQQQQQQPVKADTSYLPIFPVAPHPDNGFGHDARAAEAASPMASPYINAPSSAGMWQNGPAKSPAAANAPVAESPLIEF